MKKFGKGIATMFYPVGFTSYPNPGSAVIKMNVDGSAVLSVGSADIGQGSSTVLSQIAAEELGIKFEDLSIVASDTLTTPSDLGTVASRVTYIVGNAVQIAAKEAKKILLDAASEILNVAAQGLEAKDGMIFVTSFPEKSIPIAQAAAHSHKVKGKPILACGSFNPATTMLDPQTGHGKPYGAYVFGTQLVELEVDTETGIYDIKKIVAVHDCGKAINPILTEGQIEGGVTMGLGFGTMEEMVLKDCAVQNGDFTNYLIPTALDVPQIITGIVESPEATGPFGAKAVGEPSLLPTAPAIANAIQDAVGVRIRHLPITPEKVLMAIKELEGSQSCSAE